MQIYLIFIAECVIFLVLYIHSYGFINLFIIMFLNIVIFTSIMRIIHNPHGINRQKKPAVPTRLAYTAIAVLYSPWNYRRKHSIRSILPTVRHSACPYTRPAPHSSLTVLHDWIHIENCRLPKDGLPLHGKTPVQDAPSAIPHSQSA